MIRNNYAHNLKIYFLIIICCVLLKPQVIVEELQERFVESNFARNIAEKIDLAADYLGIYKLQNLEANFLKIISPSILIGASEEYANNANNFKVNDEPITENYLKATNKIPSLAINSSKESKKGTNLIADRKSYNVSRYLRVFSYSIKNKHSLIKGMKWSFNNILNKNLTGYVYLKKPVRLIANINILNSIASDKGYFLPIALNFNSFNNVYVDVVRKNAVISSAANAKNLPVIIPKDGQKVKVLLVGDSMMMEGFGPALLASLRKNKNLIVNREAVYSTGLCRRDYFDWPNHMKELHEKYQPDLVIIHLGANDVQDIVTEEKKRLHLGSEQWAKEYLNRAKELNMEAAKDGTFVVWVGMPVMGSEKIEKFLRMAAKQQAKAASSVPNSYFIETQRILADDKGRFTMYKNNKEGLSKRIRAKDKIHLTLDGGKILNSSIYPMIESMIPNLQVNIE